MPPKTVCLPIVLNTQILSYIFQLFSCLPHVEANTTLTCEFPAAVISPFDIPTCIHDVNIMASGSRFGNPVLNEIIYS